METKYLLPEDKAKYKEFVDHHFMGLAKRRPILPLYHYTSGTSLIRIIESGKLWTTQISCLNDAKEIIHAIELLQNAILQREKCAVSPEFALLLVQLRELLANPNPEVAGIFVTCFSERRDDLSQWRAYGGAEGGYAIEFDTEKLLKSTVENRGYLMPVTYDEDAKEILMADILKWSEEYFMEGLRLSRAPSPEEWADEFARYWLDSLAYLAPVLKHPSFKDEAEWRLIYLLKFEDVQKLQFVEHQSMMTRHVPLEFSKANSSGYTELPLSGVMVGPKIHQRLSRIAVGDLLASRGYVAENVPVTLTDIPFRTAR